MVNPITRHPSNPRPKKIQRKKLKRGLRKEEQVSRPIIGRISVVISQKKLLESLLVMNSKILSLIYVGPIKPVIVKLGSII